MKHLSLQILKFFLFLSHRLLFYRGPTVREKSVKNEKSSRSGKGQGILI